MTQVIQMQQLWTVVQERLKTRFSEDIFEMWFKPLALGESDGQTQKVYAPNDFVLMWLQDNYGPILEAEFTSVYGKERKLDLTVRDVPPARSPTKTPAAPARTTPAIRETADPLSGSGINPRYTFENFVVGSGNQLAHAAALAVANAPARAYNPLFIYGETGLGKTHLMHAVAHQMLKDNPSAKVAYISTEKFTNKFITAIQENKLTAFRRRFRKVDILLIDDIHFLAGKERIQEEFFHTFNDLFDSGRQIFLTSDRPASEIAKLESRLISRFQWGLVADIQCPDLDTRLAIISKKARSLKVNIPHEILEFLAQRVSRNVRRMEGALTRVAGYAALVKDQLSVPVVENLLNDILQEELMSRVSVDKIQQKTAEYFHLRVADLLGRRRPSKIVVPRQIAMYLSRMLTDHSLVQIGDAFGGRDHGTVINAIRAVENMIEQDETVRRSIDYLTKNLSQSNL